MKKPTLLISLILLTALNAPPSATQSESPEKRYGSAMVYDEANKRIILFGGSEWDDTPTFYDDTWSYSVSNNTWVRLNTPVKPPPRFNPGVVYIKDRGIVLLFGGYRIPGGSYGDMWLFDVNKNTWRELNPTTKPPARTCMGMTYDEKNRKVILFGGRGESYPISDTWAYDIDSNTWTEMHPPASPRPQYGVGMIYDSLNGRVLLLEGHYVTVSESGAVRDGYNGGLYTYDFSTDTWRQVECTPPSGRYWYSTAYNSDLGQMIIFGGIRWLGGYGKLYDETWIYDSKANTWSKPNIKGPEKRYITPIAYDKEHKVAILFGGADVIGEAPGGGDLRKYFRDTWALNSTPAWTLKISNATTPVTPIGEKDTSSGIPANPIESLLLGLGIAYIYLMYAARRR